MAVFAFLALCSPRPLPAFSYDEHCKVSNRALARAMKYDLCAAGDPRCTRPVSDWTALTQLLKGSPCTGKFPAGADTVTYGDRVALADWTLSPLDYYVAEPEHLKPDQSAAQAFAAGSPPDDALRALAADTAQAAYAAHGNDDHFYDRVAFGQWFWHGRAVDLARAGNLGAALMLNAYADHLLEDGLAPGHVYTPRQELHDAAAAAMHDYYNDHALYFDLTNAAELTELAGDQEEQLTGLTRVKMMGDGHLDEDCDRSLVVELIVARSIADVLESWETGAAVNHFEPPQFQGYSASREDWLRIAVRTPSLKTHYGQFKSNDGARLHHNVVLALTLGADSFFGADAAPMRWQAGADVLTWGSPGNKWVRHQAWSPPFGVMVGFSFARGGDVSVYSPRARVVFPIARLGLQFSGTVAPSYYRQHARGDWAWDFETRLELGFGLMFLGVGFEWGHAFDVAGLRRANALATTLSVMPPTGLLKKVFGK